MRIEHINLIGFKSFSEKTSFHFHPGLTAIVGPNGCGKSNVVDAFKWVLGEQSAKSLRGDQMEDVIFNGSAVKKAKGMAEVTLALSGIDAPSSEETEKVFITRRLYRSGESEYLMNKISCRLKDIKNMFLDTGLELKAYSILEQGKMDVILNSKPKDRRFLIEEVAGVMKYNIRKTEALSKLENSRSNLQRLQDIVNEVKRQINSIERYAKRAEKYKKLFDEIRRIEIKISFRDVTSMKEQLHELIESDNSLKSREAEISTHIHSSDALIEEKRLSFVEKEKTLEGVLNRLNAMEREFIEEEGRISLSRSESDNLKGRLQRLKLREDEMGCAEEGFVKQTREIEGKKGEFYSAYEEIENKLETGKKKLVALEGEISELEKKSEEKRRDIFRKTDELSTIRNEINSLTLIGEGLRKKDKINREEILDTRDIVTSIEMVIREAREIFGRLDRELQDIYATKEEILGDIDEKKQELSLLEARLYSDREELAALNSRKESLQEIDRKGKSALNDRVKILCQVADIFEVQRKYETAIEAVLGDRLNTSIVDDRGTIKAAIQVIKEKNMNRSRFISLDISPLTPSPAISRNGVLGKASEFVSIKEGYERIAATLLDDVIVVDTLDTAIDVWNSAHRAAPEGLDVNYFVTLDGEVLEHSGVVSGGIEKGVLKIKREIRELTKALDKKRDRIASAEEEIKDIRHILSTLESKQISLDREMTKKAKEHHEQQLRIAGMEEEDSQYRKKMDILTAEVEDNRNEMEAAHRKLEDKNAVSRELQKEKQSSEEEARLFLKEASDKKTALESVRSEHTEKMMLRTSLKEKIDALEREHARLEDELAEMKKRKQQMSHEYGEIERDIQQREEDIQRRENLLKTSVLSIGKLKEESSGLKEVLEAQSAELNLVERQLKEYSDELTSVRKELSRIEVKKTELSLGITHIKQNINNVYSVDLENIAEEEKGALQLIPGEEDKLQALRGKLQELGPVNLGSLDELKELKTRYDFLINQQEDLLKSIESLQETISKINRTTKKKLSEAFEALNQKFKEVFTMLFGKGRAELILTDENILEAGIDIVAQPPGKKLQNLMLLSGGEKALTVLSLLFAGFMIKPTPLCLLDEVDAPLDESNTDRFTTLLRELARNIQFIIITHNRRTMEVADYLYGVTMEEPGISKTVSMHLTEAV